MFCSKGHGGGGAWHVCAKNQPGLEKEKDMNTADKIYEQVKILPEPMVQEILGLVESLKRKSGRSNTDVSAVLATRACSMRAACGIWKDRSFPPSFPRRRESSDRNDDHGRGGSWSSDSQQ